MRFEQPAPEDREDLQRLWKLVFGDPDDFVKAFFETGYAPERCRLARDGRQTAGMLFWFDVLCRDRKLAYLYGVATHPDHRGRGVCRSLMEDTRALLRQRGYAGVLLVPQDPGLRQMYRSFGYRDCTRIAETFCAAAGAPADLHGISREEYALLRRQLLPEGGVLQEGAGLDFLQTQVRFYRGTGFLLAAAADGEDTLFAPELLGSAEAAPGILRALGFARGTFRTPGNRLPFAMFLPLEEDIAPPDYFGLAFD